MHMTPAKRKHRPPAFAQAGRVSLGPDHAWHLPARQTGGESLGQLQEGPGALLAIARANAAMYWAATHLLTAAPPQRSHAAAGHDGTSPTPTQSLSTMQDWSY